LALLMKLTIRFQSFAILRLIYFDIQEFEINLFAPYYTSLMDLSSYWSNNNHFMIIFAFVSLFRIFYFLHMCRIVCKKYNR
jgi:hypothetical protein